MAWNCGKFKFLVENSLNIFAPGQLILCELQDAKRGMVFGLSAVRVSEAKENFAGSRSFYSARKCSVTVG